MPETLVQTPRDPLLNTPNFCRKISLLRSLRPLQASTAFFHTASLKSSAASPPTALQACGCHLRWP